MRMRARQLPRQRLQVSRVIRGAHPTAPLHIGDLPRWGTRFWGTISVSGQEWPENAALIWSAHVPADIRDLFEVHDYYHACAILSSEFPGEFREVCDALRAFRISTTEIKAPGGNESDIPKKVSAILRPSWKAAKLQA